MAYPSPAAWPSSSLLRRALALSRARLPLLTRLFSTLQTAASSMIRPAARAAACALLSSRPPPAAAAGPPSWLLSASAGGAPPQSSWRCSSSGPSASGSAAFVSTTSRRSTAHRSTSATRAGGSTAPFSASSKRQQRRRSDDDSSAAECSSRGGACPGLLPAYLSDARAVTKYHPVDAPDGALQLSVAENQMLEDLLVPAVSKYASGGDGGVADELFRSDMIYYQQTHGRAGLRDAAAGYLKRILKLDERCDLDADGLVLGAGCNAVLENLCLCLAERGDAVLIPTPYYAAFEFDLVARAALEIVPVNTVEHSGADVDASADSLAPVPVEAYFPTRASLDAAYDEAERRGCPPRILLLSHPNNPLGVCYPPSVVKECIEWGRERKVHVVSDEIYAGSVHQEKTPDGEDTFVSALTLAAGHDAASAGLGLGPYVHFVYALSKDFALSGLRVGVCYSENAAIRLPMQKLNDLCQISSQTQLLVERMLNSPWSTDEFLPENRRRIRDRCDRLQRCLTDAGVPHLPADSGLFVWMDLREFLPPVDDPTSSISPDSGVERRESMEKRERALYLNLLNERGLLFTPGLSMRNELPGFFRCVFTAASDEEFDLGLERIAESVAAMREEKSN